MACDFQTEHCLWGSGPSSVCCDLGYNYPELYNFNQVDTGKRQCCFLGIKNEPGSCDAERRSHGRSCGFGCEHCDDGGVDGGLGLNQYEFIDGQRWLMAVPRSQGRNWDARGRIHDLLSNEYHPIPGRIVYERGTCYQNDGVECFGADACACFGDNTIDPIFQHPDNCGGVGAGNPLPGLLPDEFFRTGFRWPPDSFEGFTQGSKQWHCRKFGETRIDSEEGGHHRSMVVVDPTHTGGLDGVTESLMDPALLSSNACQSDRMADCTGVLAQGSPCDWFSAYGVCTGRCIPPDNPECLETCAHTFYAGSVVASKFDKLRISRDPGPGPDGRPHNYPHIIGSDDHSQLGGATAAWKNAILDMVRTHDFPLEPEEGGAERTTRFDRLDHQAHIVQHNAGIGLYVREWVGTPSTLVKVPSGSGVGRLRQAGCAFEYSTWITRVKIVCRLILQQQRPENREGGFINPLVRLHIIATTTISVSNLGDECVFVSSHDGLPVNLEIVNEWDGSQYILKLSHGDTPVDYGESFMLFDSDGRQFIPSPVVEWRGFLGGHSKPTSAEQTWDTGTCTFIAERFFTKVPGWPTNVDTPGGPEGDDPARIYGGHVVLDFIE